MLHLENNAFFYSSFNALFVLIINMNLHKHLRYNNNNNNNNITNLCMSINIKSLYFFLSFNVIPLHIFISVEIMIDKNLYRSLNFTSTVQLPTIVWVNKIIKHRACIFTYKHLIKQDPIVAFLSVDRQSDKKRERVRVKSGRKVKRNRADKNIEISRLKATFHTCCIRSSGVSMRYIFHRI